MIEVREYRGHIRNWRELSKELFIGEKLKREEREKEILVKAYEKWGTSMPERLSGMFAFALYDNKKEELFCARDHFGTKPFYYYITEDGRLLYGTMIRKIMKEKGFVKELNEAPLQIYLSLTYLPGEDTFFKGVKRLLPGSFLTFKNGELKVGRYFQPEFRPESGRSLESFADEIHETVKKIFEEVKEEGEEFHSFLSGGVDSSYVLAMSDVKRASSCGYRDERFNEADMAGETAKLLHKEHSVCLIEPEAYFQIVPYVMYHMEQPLGDASAVAFALGCIETAKKAKFCYSGEGADEFFGGYNSYRNADRFGDDIQNQYVGNTYIMKEEEKKLLLKNYDEENLPIGLVKEIYERAKGLDNVSKMSLVDISIWLDGDIYLNVDKMSTAAGIEVRMPFTDRRMYEIASRMPSEYKVTDSENKVAFRTAASKALPSEIAFRKKLGFIVPIRIWLADERYNRDVVRIFRSEFAEKFFKTDAIMALFQDYLGGNSDNWRKVWTIYAFLVWYEEYFVKR